MSGDNLSDDYVAKLLKNDAKANSSQYRSLGVGAFLPTRCLVPEYSFYDVKT